MGAPRTKKSVYLLGSLFALAFLPHAAHSQTLDQSFTVGGNGALGSLINAGSAYIGQTYTAGKDGTLYGIRLQVNRFSQIAYPLVVSLRGVTDDLPNTTLLGQTALSSGGTTLADWILIPQTIEQTAGRKYAIVLNYAGAPPPGTGNPLGAMAGGTQYDAASQRFLDLYTGGDLVASTDPNGVTDWYRFHDASKGGPFDAFFVTSVSPSAVPEPAFAAYLLGSGAFTGLLVRCRFGYHKNTPRKSL